jgi:hypothetical protein
MHHYRVFGGVLSSEQEFPELVAASESPAPEDDSSGGWQWELTVQTGSPPAGGVLAGEEELATGIWARLYRTEEGLRLEFDDTGSFTIGSGGERITWHPRDGHDPELARVDIVSRVLAAAVHERGLICLHGSAVTLGGQGGWGGRAIAFLAPKGAGKSTLAATFLTVSDAALLTDDTLPVDPASGLAQPGVQSVRLVADAADRFGGLGEARTGLSDKRLFERLPEAMLARNAVPIAAIYELAARPASWGEGPVRRTTCAGAESALVLMRHTKLGGLLGGTEARRVFERSTALAARVPVYRLDVRRDASALLDVAQTIRGWHA